MSRGVGTVCWEFSVPFPFFKKNKFGLSQWDDPEGWNGEGGGRRVQDGETCII